MEKKRPKLELKRRTIANLSNLEMKHVYGGGGDDEGDISRNHCTTIGKEDESRNILDEAAHLVLSRLIAVC